MTPDDHAHDEHFEQSAIDASESPDLAEPVHVAAHDSSPEAQYVEQRELLFIDIANRQAAALAEIPRLEGEINMHRRAAATRSEWQDHTAAQTELAQVAPKLKAIEVARIRLKDLETERGLATDGRHASLQGIARNTASNVYRSAIQTEHRQASDAFEACITPELRTAAARLVMASKRMGFDFIPSPIAVAITQTT